MREQDRRIIGFPGKNNSDDTASGESQEMTFDQRISALGIDTAQTIYAARDVAGDEVAEHVASIHEHINYMVTTILEQHSTQASLIIPLLEGFTRLGVINRLEVVSHVDNPGQDPA